MMPVIRGERATQRQMFWYALSLIPVAWLLVAVNADLGWLSFGVLTLLGGIFTWKVHCLRPLVTEKGEPARVGAGCRAEDEAGLGCVLVLDYLPGTPLLCAWLLIRCWFRFFAQMPSHPTLPDKRNSAARARSRLR